MFQIFKPSFQKVIRSTQAKTKLFFCLGLSPRFLCATAFSSVFLACGPSVVVKTVQKKTLTWSDELKLINAKSDGSAAPKKTVVSFELWTESQEPFTLERLEASLAQTGVLAESNGSDTQFEMSVGVGSCKLNWSTVDHSLKIKKAERLSQCRDTAEATLKPLKNARSVIQMSCTGLSGGGLIDLHNMSVAVSKAIESPKAVEGEKITKTYQSPLWFHAQQKRCGEAQKLNQYRTEDQLTFKRYKLSETDDSWAVQTQGLSTFNLNEITLLFLPSAKLKAAEAKLLALADFAIRIEGLVSGQSFTSGITQGMYVPILRLQAQHQKLDLPSELSNSLTPVNPQSTVTDLEAIKKFNLKLTVR